MSDDNVTPMPSPVERVINLSLTRSAAGALEQATETTGLSEADAMNVAIQVYAMIAERLNRGETVLFQHPDQALMNRAE